MSYPGKAATHINIVSLWPDPAEDRTHSTLKGSGGGDDGVGHEW